MIKFQVHASSSAGNLYSVDDGATKLLIECGLSLKQIRAAVGFGLSGYSGALVSHAHGDHSKAAKDLAKSGVDIYASRGTAETLGLSGHRIHPIEAQRQFEVGSWTILPFDVEHDAAEPLNFLLSNETGERLLYVTDTPFVKYRFERLSVLVVECNHSVSILRANVEAGVISVDLKNRILRSHMALERLIEFLKANDMSRLQETILIHLSDNNSDEALFKRKVMEVTGRPVTVARA